MEKKKGLYTEEMVQTTINVPTSYLVDLDRLVQDSGLSRNAFCRRYLKDGIEKDKRKRGWI